MSYLAFNYSSDPSGYWSIADASGYQMPTVFIGEDSKRLKAPTVLSVVGEDFNRESVFTGIRPIKDWLGWFYGDLVCGDKRKSFLIFHFSFRNPTKCKVYLFDEYYPRDRIRFSNYMITGYLSKGKN
jgi:hypothetical protein